MAEIQVLLYYSLKLLESASSEDCGFVGSEAAA